MKKNRVNIKSVLSTPTVKVISVSGVSGDTLEKHKVSEPAVLLVKKGSVTYAEGAQKLLLSEGSGHSIPAEVYHQVTCNEPAEVFVVIPQQGKIKFDRSTED